MDAAHIWTDEQIAKLERIIRRIYGEAMKDVRAELQRLLEGYGDELKRRLDALDENDPEDIAEFERWRSGMTARVGSESVAFPEGALLLTLAAILMTAEGRALKAANDALLGVFAENANHSARSIEKALRSRGNGAYIGIRFDLMDEHTAKLITDGYRELFPRLKVDNGKSTRWHKQKIYSAVTQGIMNGESIPKISKRVQSVSDMSRQAATRAARTACTAAENLGRLERFREAKSKGIAIRKQWIATDDNRTRQSHRRVNREIVEVEERFSNGLLCPGDPGGEPAEVWNCRCSLGSVLDD